MIGWRIAGVASFDLKDESAARAPQSFRVLRDLPSGHALGVSRTP